MRPFVHALASVGIAAGVYAFSHSPGAAVGAFVAGTLIDADHLVDCWVVHGWQLSISKLLGTRYFHQSRKIYVLLHGWEYLVLFWLLHLLHHDLALTAGISISYTMHLVLDYVAYNGHLWTYSLIARCWHHFDLPALQDPRRVKRMPSVEA